MKNRNEDNVPIFNIQVFSKVFVGKILHVFKINYRYKFS